MKKFLLGAAALFLLVNCAGKGASEKDQEESDRIADSIAQVEAERAAAEQARQDSIRQDSIQKAEEFAAVVKALEKLPENRDRIPSYLKSLGFEGSKKTSTKTDDYLGSQIEIEVEKYYYTLTMGDKRIIYSFEIEETLAYGNSTEKITIEGDEEALDNFYRFAKRKNVQAEVTKKGNTVIISDSWL